MGIKDFARRKFQDIVGEGEGTAGRDVEGGIRSPKPYSSYYSNGIFQGENGSLWIYFHMPEDVKVQYVESYTEAAENQSFLLDVFDDLGRSLNVTESTKKDPRIKWHIPMIREITREIQQPFDITPAQSDFLSRMNVSKRQVWHSYFGVELQMGSISSDIYGISDKVRNYVDFMMGRMDFEYTLYKDSLELTNSICMDYGMTPLDFEAEPKDLERLTAWYGISDDKYNMRPDIVTTAIDEPEHGKSIFTPAYGEIAFSAVRPRESKDMFMQDPYNSGDVRFGRAILSPSVNAVHVNIRGEIRSPETATKIFDKKSDRNEDRAEAATSINSDMEDRRRMEQQNQMLEIASGAAGQGHAFLDNVELIVATLVTGKKNELNTTLNTYGLEATNTTMRQIFALNSTIPTYPNTVFKVPKSNSRRNPNVNTFYGGILSLSGLFSTTKPAGKSGVLLGLSDANYDYKEIFVETNASNKYSKPPTTLVIGTSGSGKTVQLLMMAAQYVYLGTSVFFLNPKPQNTLKPFFDHLDGITINLSNNYLDENPGMLDPMFFIEDRKEAGRLLADMIIRAQGMNSKTNQRVLSIRQQEELTTELVEHAQMPANECSYDVIFGNQKHGANTPRLSDDDTVAFVKQKMVSSPFWKASISQNPDGRSGFLTAIRSGRPFLVEWDNSISMPASKNEDDWTQQERDGVQSVVNLFKFGAETIGNSRRGGALVVDEAHIMQTSEVAMNLVKKSGREWRSQDINLILATQNMADFLDDNEYNIFPYVRLFIIMNLAETTKELDIFFDLTKFPRDEEHKYYITHAAMETADSVRNKKRIPNAIVIDNAYDIKTGIMCGPWPSRELQAATGKHIKDILQDDQQQLQLMTFEELSRISLEQEEEQNSVSDL